MEFVDVLKSPTPYTKTLDVMPSVLKHVKNVLIPLDPAYEAQFQTHKVDNFHEKILDFKERYKNATPNVWIDSGGYAFTRGRFLPKHVPGMIKIYHYFIEKYFQDISYIFSLDLNFNRKDNTFCTDLEKIKEANYASLKNSRDLIEKNPVLADKFYFVEHFVASGRYDIWGELYNELDLCRYVKNRALGGMVGLRTNRPNAPSPFIGMAFKCFVDFLNAYEHHKDIEFRLHFLGIYLLQDRFEIALLEQLFQKLQPDIKIRLTYDSSVASVQAMKRHLYLPAFVKTKNGSYRYLNSFDEINVFLDINSPSDDIMYNLRYIYDESNIKTARQVMEKSFPKRELRLKNEIYKMINKESGKKVKKDTGLLNIFEPFNISSNRHIDDILRVAIESHGAVNILLDSKDIDEVRTSSNQFLMHISHCSEHDRYGEQGVKDQAEMDLFGKPHQLWAIRNNIVETYPFYRWFLDKQDDKKSLGEMIKSYVEKHYHKKR